MPGQDMNMYANPGRSLALVSPQNDGAGPQNVRRGGRYGELYAHNVVPTKHGLADEGSYFAFSNPTPGTAIAYGSAGTQASFSATVPFFLFKNNNLAGGKRVALDYLKLIQITGTAPATTTSVQAAMVLDVNRAITSAASTYTLITPVRANNDDTANPGAQIWVPNGAVATIPAATSSSRVAGRAQLKGGPTLVLDEYSISFGSVDGAPGGGYLTTVAAYTTRMPPILLAPQEFAILYLWFPGGATNPYTFEFEGGLWER